MKSRSQQKKRNRPQARLSWMKALPRAVLASGDKQPNLRNMKKQFLSSLKELQQASQKIQFTIRLRRIIKKYLMIWWTAVYNSKPPTCRKISINHDWSSKTKIKSNRYRICIQTPSHPTPRPSEYQESLKLTKCKRYLLIEIYHSTNILIET